MLPPGSRSQFHAPGRVPASFWFLICKTGMHVKNRGFTPVGVVRTRQSTRHRLALPSRAVSRACWPLALRPALRTSGPFLTASPTSPLQLVRL